LPIGLIAGISGAAVVILFLVGGIAIWFLRGSQSVVANSSSAANQAVVINNGQLKRVKIDIDEGKAQILRDGTNLGQTPYDLDAKDGEKVNLTLRRDGYEDKNVLLEIKGSKQVYTFSLKQKP
jgi:PEGA domain